MSANYWSPSAMQRQTGLGSLGLSPSFYNNYSSGGATGSSGGYMNSYNALMNGIAKTNASGAGLGMANANSVSGGAGTGGSGASSADYRKKMWAWAQDAVGKMSGEQEKANSEMRDRQGIAETMFADLIEQYKNDDMFNALKAGWKQWSANPGISDATRQRLEAQTLARAAADTSAAMTSARRGAANLGLSGGLAAQGKSTIS